MHLLKDSKASGHYGLHLRLFQHLGVPDRRSFGGVRCHDSSTFHLLYHLALTHIAHSWTDLSWASQSLWFKRECSNRVTVPRLLAAQGHASRFFIVRIWNGSSLSVYEFKYSPVLNAHTVRKEVKPSSPFTVPLILFLCVCSLASLGGNIAANIFISGAIPSFEHGLKITTDLLRAKIVIDAVLDGLVTMSLVSLLQAHRNEFAQYAYLTIAHPSYRPDNLYSLRKESPLTMLMVFFATRGLIILTCQSAFFILVCYSRRSLDFVMLMYRSGLCCGTSHCRYGQYDDHVQKCVLLCPCAHVYLTTSSRVVYAVSMLLTYVNPTLLHFAGRYAQRHHTASPIARRTAEPPDLAPRVRATSVLELPNMWTLSTSPSAGPRNRIPSATPSITADAHRP